MSLSFKRLAYVASDTITLTLGEFDSAGINTTEGTLAKCMQQRRERPRGKYRALNNGSNLECVLTVAVATTQ